MTVTVKNFNNKTLGPGFARGDDQDSVYSAHSSQLGGTPAGLRALEVRGLGGGRARARPAPSTWGRIRGVMQHQRLGCPLGALDA